MLAVRDVAVTLGRQPALHGVSAALERGSVTAICGPNGAGKSTLLSVFAGLIGPDRGDATLDGQSLHEIAPQMRARTIGYLPQSGDIAWDVAVGSLVALGRLPHGDAAGAGKAAIARAMAALDLDGMARRPISRLSGGERARALLARVLAGEPDWILADEPLAALDLAHQLTLLARLRETARKGAGVVLVLHDLALARNCADRVLVLEKGKVAADGPPQEALSEGVIARVWGVEARWLGEPGGWALATRA